MHTHTFKITNLTCGACVKLSESVLSKIDGVVSVAIDLSTGLGQLQSARVITKDEMSNALKSVSKEVLFLNN